jgi:hypothetical protein
VCRHPGFGVVHFAQHVVALIGDDDPRLLGVDGGIWEVGGIAQRTFGDGLEKGRFTDIGQTDLQRGEIPSEINAMNVTRHGTHMSYIRSRSSGYCPGDPKGSSPA